jgi:hypothetical protein
LAIEELDKRINMLENQLYDFTFPEGSTTFLHENFTEKEKVLIDRLQQLHKKYEDYMPEDVLKANQNLIEAVDRIYWLRLLDLFRTIAIKRFCRTSFEEVRFHFEFFSFLHNLSLEFERNRLHEAKIRELFGDDPRWYSEDDDAIPDSDPRWKVLDDYENDLIRKNDEDLKRYREEMAERIFSSNSGK